VKRRWSGAEAQLEWSGAELECRFVAALEWSGSAVGVERSLKKNLGVERSSK